jgi:hypothetical protein
MHPRIAEKEVSIIRIGDEEILLTAFTADLIRR